MARTQGGKAWLARAGLGLGASRQRVRQEGPAAGALTVAELGFLDAAAHAIRERGEAEVLRAVAGYAEIHAMESGSFLPTNEHPFRYLIRRGRETGDADVLAGAIEEVEGLLMTRAPAC